MFKNLIKPHQTFHICIEHDYTIYIPVKSDNLSSLQKRGPDSIEIVSNLQGTQEEAAVDREEGKEQVEEKE